MDNATKYCKKVPEILVKSYIKQKELIIEISDNGIGIQKDHFENLFKKFYRVPTGDVHDVKGFGLGLYYVHNICQAHGWKVNVFSVPENGSTFSFRIPING